MANLLLVCSGHPQVGAVADVIVQLPELETLLLAGNDLDDLAFELLGSQLDTPGAASITHLDLADNRLGVASLKLLLPLLRHEELAEMARELSRQSTHTAAGGRRVRHSDDSGFRGVESGEMKLKEAAAPADPSSTPKPDIPRNAGAAKGAPGQVDRDPGEFTSWKFLKESLPIAWEDPSPPKNATPAEVARWWRQRTLKLSRSGRRRATSMNQGFAEPIGGARLSVLDLSGNTGIKDVGIELLSSAIQKAPTGLQTLRIARCGLSKLSAIALGKALENKSPLEELDMSWNELGLGGARALADGIRASEHLVVLKLGNCGLTDQGAAHIAKALQGNTSVQCLDISGNGANADAGLVFSATLRLNRTLEHLLLCNNGLGYTAARRLLQVVHGSPLKQLDLRGCSFFHHSIAAPITQPLPDSHANSQPSASSVAIAFNSLEPEGLYTLDLSNPAHHQVAVELLVLASQEEGLLALRGLNIDQKAHKIASPDQVPTKGVLTVRAVALKPTFYTDTPLSEAEFKSRWLDIAGASNIQHRDPYTTAAASKAVRSPPRTSPSPSTHQSHSPSACPTRPSTAPPIRPSSPPCAPAYSGNMPNTGNVPVTQRTAHGASSTLMSQRPHTAHAVSGVGGRSQGGGGEQVWVGAGFGTEREGGERGGRGVKPAMGDAVACGVGTKGGDNNTPNMGGNDNSMGVKEQNEREALGDLMSHGQEKLESVAEGNEECLDGTQERTQEQESGSAHEEQGQADKHEGRQRRPTQMTRFSSAIHRAADLRPSKPRPSSSTGSSSSSAAEDTANHTWHAPTPHPSGLSVSLFSLAHVRAASDAWRMSLLEVMIADAFLTCRQLCQVVECMHEPDQRLQAALMGFGVLSDPHLLHHVLEILEPQQVEAFKETLGDLIMYHPANPTGQWTMRMSGPQDAIVARHLLVGFLQQHYMQLTRHPHNVCFTLLMIDGKHHDLPPDPHKIVLPSSGTLNLCFVDLQPVKTPPHPVRSPSPHPPSMLSKPEPFPEEAASPEPGSGCGDKGSTAAPHRSGSAGPLSEPQPPCGVQPPFNTQQCHTASPSPPFSSTPSSRTITPRASPTPPTKPHSTSSRPGEPEMGAAAAAEAAEATAAEHSRPLTVPRGPVVFSEPVLLDAGQMDALVAALQHWPALDPIGLVQLVDTSGCMEAQEAMQALGYPQKPTWAEAFLEQELHEGVQTLGNEEGSAVHAAARLLASGGSRQLKQPPSARATLTRTPSVPRRPTSALSRSSSSAWAPHALNRVPEQQSAPSAQRQAHDKHGDSAAASPGRQSRGSSARGVSSNTSSRRPSSAVHAQPDTAAAGPAGLQSRGSSARGASSITSRGRPSSAVPAIPAGATGAAAGASAGAQLLAHTIGSHPFSTQQAQQAWEDAPEAAGPPLIGQSLRSRSSADGWGPVRGDLVGLRDHVGFVEAMRMLAVSHYITCEQLATLLALLPVVNKRGAPSLCVELCTMFWARIVDRNPPDPLVGGFTSVMRRLAPQQQVCLAQRLGYMNIFNRKRPAMHYCLRMYRADEHEIAWQLFNMAINASHTCFLDFHVDGVPKKVNQGPNMWPVMNGNAATGTVPQTTCEFDFAWDPKVVAEAAKAKKKKR